MKARFASAPAALLLAAAVSACGSLAGNTTTPPVLATLTGQVTNPSTIATSGDVRIAVVWLGLNDGQFNVAQDLPVQPVFPSSFLIDLDGPPPASSMFNPSSGVGSSSQNGAKDPNAPSGDPDAQAPSAPPSTMSPPSDFEIAVGVVVAYVDVNGNGKLDLVPTNAGAYIDQIVGANSNLAILYTQGTLPTDIQDAQGKLPSLGYNLAQTMECQETTATPGSSAPSGPPCDSPLWLPMSTLYTLPLSASPQVSQLMCEVAPGNSGSGGVSTSPGPSVQPAEYPAPGAMGLSCTSDGSSYEYTQCTTVSTGICQGNQSTCTSSSYMRPTPVPAGWPCP